MLHGSRFDNGDSPLIHVRVYGCVFFVPVCLTVALSGAFPVLSVCCSSLFARTIPWWWWMHFGCVVDQVSGSNQFETHRLESIAVVARVNEGRGILFSLRFRILTGPLRSIGSDDVDLKLVLFNEGIRDFLQCVFN